MKAPSPRTLELLRELVAFDTTSRTSNLDLLAQVEEILRGAGFGIVRVPTSDGAKASLLASAGPDRPDGLLLSAHTDCVPVTGQRWATPPFELTDGGDGRWYGRGSADMKGFIASLLAAVETADMSHLERPLHIALTHDEETGGEGARNLVAAMAESGVTARACIVGEPTSMRIVTEHKGIFVFRVEVQGTSAHSSLAPRAVNAIEYAAELIGFLHAMATDRATNGPFEKGYDVTHTTVHVGTIEGGTAVNVVPRHCEFEFEFRHLPADDPDAMIASIEAEVARLRSEMQRVSPEADITLTHLGGLPHLLTAEDAAVVEWLTAHTGVGLGKVAYGTEAGLFAATLGLPTVVCGPGSIDQAHGRDEYVDGAQLAACDSLFSSLLSELGV